MFVQNVYKVKRSMQSILFKILPFKSAMFKVSKAPNTKPLFGKHYVCSYDVVEEGRLQGSLRRHYSTLWCMFCYVCERGNEIQSVTNKNALIIYKRGIGKKLCQVDCREINVVLRKTC